MTYALYLNGLSDGMTSGRERVAMRYLAKHGIQVELAALPVFVVFTLLP